MAANQNTRDGQVILSRGTQVVAGLLFGAIVTIGGWGLAEMRGMREESARDRQAIREEVGDKFDVVEGKLGELITQQAVMSAQMGRTNDIEDELDDLRAVVSELRFQLATLERNRPDQ